METSANYYRVEELSNEEKKKLYMGMDKEAIVDMLIECNKIINNVCKLVVASDKPAKITFTSTQYRGSHNCAIYDTSACQFHVVGGVCPCPNWSLRICEFSNASMS